MLKNSYIKRTTKDNETLSVLFSITITMTKQQ